jgi:hypothetical protein
VELVVPVPVRQRECWVVDQAPQDVLVEVEVPALSGEE